MARLVFPDEGSRVVYLVSAGFMRSVVADTPVNVFTDAAATVPATDLLAHASYPSSVVGSTVLLDAFSRIPLFQGPNDGTDTLYVQIVGGPITPLYARVDDRLDAVGTTQVAHQGAIDTLTTTQTTQQGEIDTLNAEQVALQDNLDAEAARAAAAELDISNTLDEAVPSRWTDTQIYPSGAIRSYGGSEFVANSDVPQGVAPRPLGDGSPEDRQILLAGRCGWASTVVGGDAFPTITVSNSNASGAGSFAQALADAKAGGGGYIVWDPAGGPGGVYTHTLAHGQAYIIPSNTTLNAWAADVTIAGGAYDDNTTFSVGGRDGDDFTNYYGGVPAHEIIITALKFISNEGTGEEHGDMATTRFWSYNIWWDHCYLHNGNWQNDGLFDITHSTHVTVSWMDFFQHHKAVLAHTKPLVNSPSGNQLPPGVTKAAPGVYPIVTVNIVGGSAPPGPTDCVAEQVSYIHCLWDQCAQRNPETDFDASFLTVDNCWIRNFGSYNDGVNPQVPNGAPYNWPTMLPTDVGSRWTCVTNPGPATGPVDSPTHISVAGPYRRNSGAGSKINSSGGSDKGGHMLIRNTTYTNLPGDTNIAIRNGGGCFRQHDNVFENAPVDAEHNPSLVPDPSYAINVIPADQIKNTIRYGVARNGDTYWTRLGPSTLGTVGTVTQWEGANVGAAKVINYTGTAVTDATYSGPDDGVVTLEITSGAADPTQFLLHGLHSARPAANLANLGKYYWETDTLHLFQVTGTGPYVWSPMAPGPVAGQELAFLSYWPSSGQTTAAQTSTVLTDLATSAIVAGWTGITTTSFDITFTAPPSGVVDVNMSMQRSLSPAASEDWALLDVDASAIVTLSEELVNTSASRMRTRYDKRVTGLTPGQTYTWRWQLRTQTSAAWAGYVGGINGPVRMQVLAG